MAIMNCKMNYAMRHQYGFNPSHANYARIRRR